MVYLRFYKGFNNLRERTSTENHIVIACDEQYS